MDLRMELLCQHLAELGIPRPEFEYRFHPTRKWRFDGAWPSVKLCFEIEGGQWTRGRHLRPVGYERDLNKYNQASLSGWMLIRILPKQIENGSAAALLGEAWQAVGGKH